MIDRSLRLTRTQRVYLEMMTMRDRLNRGWGGFSSTRTARVLEERGLCRVQPDYNGPGQWAATITSRGYEALRAAEAKEAV